MRKLMLLNLLLAASLAVPAIALNGDDTAVLRERLAHTLNSLGELAGIQQRLEANDPAAVREILAISAAGPVDAAQAEYDLVSLRSAVSALLAKLDAKGLAETAPLYAPAFSDATQAALVASQTSFAGVPTPATIAAEPKSDAGATSKVRFEAEGFVADRVRMGRACWRGGRYQEGVTALEALAGNVQADYWRARCLEKLGHNAQAIELYHKVVEVAGDSPEGRSAREDSEFLQWTMLHGLAGAR